jgi:DNA repair exonuclease SbcCD ATPase subunit
LHQLVQKQLDKIELICTQSIQSILDSPEIVFKILSEKKRNNIETSFVVVDKTLGSIDLTHGEAGGTKNVVSVCLRLIFAELCNPRVDGPIILDEAGGNISADFQQGFGKFLKTFSELTNRQIILVSHFRPVISEAKSVITLSRHTEKSVQEAINAPV